MSNFNTVSDVIVQQNAGNPIVLSFGSSVGHKQVLLGAGAAVLTLPNPLAAADWTGTFGGRAATAISFIVRAGGTITAPGAGKFQIDINLGTTLAPPIASTGLVQLQPVLTSVNDNWLIEIEGMWDPTSTNVRGIVYGWVGALNISQAVLNTNTAASLAALQFNIGVTMLNANPANQVTVSIFDGELV